MRNAAGSQGFALLLVLIAFLMIELIGVGAMSIATSSLHGAVANQLAEDATNVAESGMNYAVAQLITRASAAVPTDEAYAGEAGDIVVPGPDGTGGVFRVIVACLDPRDAAPPACRNDPSAPGIDARDLRHITALGFIPGPPGRARRQIEATVRRYVPGEPDTPSYGVCGREGVDLDEATTLTADIGSNGNIRVGPSGAIRRRLPLEPASPATATRVPSSAAAGGLTGTYSWRVTLLDALGRESGGSPPTRPLVLAGQYGRLTDIPAGDSSITKRRIYRTRADAGSSGPWYLVAELADRTTQAYTDLQTDASLGFRIPGTIAGNVVAGGSVDCSEDCGRQVDGAPRSRAHVVSCPAFLPPPCRPGVERAPGIFTQRALHQELHWGTLRVDTGDTFSILTLSDPNARLDIHVTDIDLAPDAKVIVTGQGTIYVHVTGHVHLGERAAFGVEDETPTGSLVAAPDRLQILGCAHDAAYDPERPETASVRADGANRISALLFAPDANIVIEAADMLRGAIYGNHIRITRSAGSVLDPRWSGNERTGIRPTPFQYLVRWYDNPSPRP